MKFTEIQTIFRNSFGIEKLADIARELEVTPQVVNNWKIKNNVPYKNVKILKNKLKDLSKNNLGKHEKSIKTGELNENSGTEDLIKFAIQTFVLIKKNLLMFSLIVFISFMYSVIYLMFFAEPVFVSTAKVIPHQSSGNSSSGLQNIAANFGFGVRNAGSSMTSATMIPEILKSRRLASELLLHNFDNSEGDSLKNLASILSGKNIITDSLSQKNIYRLTSKVASLIAIRPEKAGPIIKVSAITNDARFAKQLVDATIKKCNDIIKNFQFKELEEKKTYINNRLSEISSELIKKEEALKSFRDKNRNITFSPTLMLEQERLIRDVTVQTELYIKLRSESEILQLEDVGMQEPVQVLDVAEIPLKNISPKPFEFIVISIFVGLSISFFAIFIKDWFNKRSNDIILIKDSYLM